MPLALVGRPCFYLIGLVGLTIGLVICEVVLIVREVTIGLSRWSLWNELISFLRCYIAEIGSQVFFSSR